MCADSAEPPSKRWHAYNGGDDKRGGCELEHASRRAGDVEGVHDGAPEHGVDDVEQERSQGTLDLVVELEPFRYDALPESYVRVCSLPQIVKDVLSAGTVELLLRGGDLRSSAAPGLQHRPRRSASSQFPGILALSQGAKSEGICDVVPRSAGRFDWTVSDRLYRQLLRPEEQKLLSDLTTGLARMRDYHGEIAASFHLMVSLPQSVDQVFHVDNDTMAFFYTIILPLTDTTMASGRTQFMDEREPLLPQPGDLLFFDGHTWHRGSRNTSSATRAFAYLKICSGQDANETNTHLEDVMVEILLMRYNEVTLKVGDCYALQGRGSVEWVARIEKILSNKVDGDVVVHVRWLYDQNDLPLGLYQCEKRERLFSAHFDDVNPTAFLRKCPVDILLPGAQDSTADVLWVRKFYDHRSKLLREIEAADTLLLKDMNMEI